MNEVSCKVFGLMLAPIAAKGLTLDDVVRDSGITPATLEDKKARIDWSQYVVIMRNLRPHFTDEEYTELGRRYLRAPGLRFAFVIARLAMSPMDFYRWFSKPKQGVGNQMFNCVVPSHRELGGGEIELDLTLPEGYEICWDWFLISKGNVEEMPALLGYPRAEVTLTRIPRGGRYRILVPQGTAFFKRVWRFITRPFVRRDAAKELREAHETLLERYEELEDARTKLDRQAARLRVAHSINVLVQRDVDVDGSLKTIAKALVEEAQYVWARIAVEGRHAEFGTKTEEPPIDAPLEGRGGERVGEVSVLTPPGADRAEQADILAFITPSLAIALQNALYRTDLERKVDERTAELREASRALAGTVEQLREAQGARERFFGNISHEIRTPLSIVLLAVADIEKRSQDKLEPRARASLTSITDSARKLVRLVDELLLLAAGREGKLRIKAEPTNLTAMMSLLIAAWTPATESAGLTLVCRAPEQVFANVDPVAIERVATNLVSNAVKYTPAPGAIEIELAIEPAHLRLSVFDTGDGISDDLAARLFGRFERGATTGNVGGTGIGLSLVKQLVEGHGGTVAAHRRPTRGTELRVELPRSVVISDPVAKAVVPAVSDAPVAPVTPAIRIAAPDALARGSILLAEDDVRLAEMISELLGAEYVVRTANDGATALEIARRHQPQLLITDVDMPGMDGIELSRRFRDVTNDRLAPVIILSAVLDLGTRIAGLDAGAVDYVTKPFDPAELEARVRAQFRMRDLAMRLHRAEQLSTLGVLTSGLAHELRNPANGVVNAVEPLRQLLPPELLADDHPVGQLLDVIGECAEQINTLARQLLGFRNSATELQVRSTKLHELVQRALSIGQEAYKDVVIRVRVPDDVTVECAPPLMVQVLTNLLENAAHAAGRGGWIEVIARSDGALVSLEIADSGPGVPVELRGKVFEPFFTTKMQGAGTGLGLAVSREIVARHRGTLEIEDQGAHSVFVVRIPRRAA